MNVVWIIGNGFDLNLGLKTSYEHFYERHYALLEDGEAIAHRNIVEGIAEQMDGDQSARWSDLELFLGQSSTFFDSVDEHYDVFHRMKSEIDIYMEQQQERLIPSDQSRSFCSEFFDSVFDVIAKLDLQDRSIIESKVGSLRYGQFDIVTLNYTDCIERILRRSREIVEADGNNGDLSTGIRQLIHAHGLLLPPKQTVFAVCDDTQVANEAFRGSDEFCLWWTKTGLDSVFGNGRISAALSAIAQGDLFVCYGCSFGATDKHLWSAIGERLEVSPDSCLLVFMRSLPEKGDDTRAFLRRQKQELTRIAAALGLPNGELLNGRVIICNSSRVFAFEGEASPALRVDSYDRREMMRRAQSRAIT